MKFQESLNNLFLLPGDGTDTWRKKSWDRFMELGLPKLKNEAFQYVPLTKLYQRSLQEELLSPAEVAPSILPECQDSYLLLVDGYFYPERSKIPAGLVALPMQTAVKSYALVLQNRIARMLKEESDPFAALNGALQGRGTFLYLPPNTKLEKPLQIIHLCTGGSLASPRIQLFVGAHACLQIIQTTEADFSNALFDCALDEAAHCSLYDISRPRPTAWQFQAIRATLKRDSRFETFHYTTGAQTVRTSIKVQLLEENCEALLRGVSKLTDHCQSHVHGLVEHIAPSCRSNQQFKAVLEGESRFSFEGKIAVRPIAQKTESYQSSKCLVLSDKAAAYAKPNLEIFADDVKASHGATVAQPDEEELFYLRSRGLSAPESKNLLVNGFCRELLDQIPFSSLRAAL